MPVKKCRFAAERNAIWYTRICLPYSTHWVPATCRIRLWSYPNPYKLQSNGKEQCDLLIVFDNHIIIFPDKECAYGDSENPQVDWRRWFKKAIQKSVEQLLDAKHWIERYTDRIAIDATCQKRFPLRIEITPEAKFHLIAIAEDVRKPLTSCSTQIEEVRKWSNYIKHKGGIDYKYLEPKSLFGLYYVPVSEASSVS